MSLFRESIQTTELFDKWIDDKYFNIVCSMERHPRYQLQRGIDCNVKMYIDNEGIAMPESWGLPFPNSEAAYKSLAKYAKPILKMDEEAVYDMNLAWDWTEKHFGMYMKDSEVVSLQEARDHLDMSTSSGAPWNVLYPKKKELFEKDPEMDKWLEEDWNLLGVDPTWTCVATNSLKEELRTAEKMAQNSIRTFTSMPVDATIHGTRLFVDMNEKMYNSHLQSASVVGMSPFDGNWNTLYKKLNKFQNGYALDEKEYDSSLRVFMMWGCAQFRYKMLAQKFRTPENKLRIQTYYRNLINTLILTPEGIIIQKKTGNPSGSCNTITDNTLILYTLMAYAWIRTSKKNNVELTNYEDFENHTRKALVGDDNTWTVSDEAHCFYNAVSVIDVWKTLGVTTTTDSLEAREAEYLDFLSAQFLPMSGVMVPIYDREKVMNSVYYAPKKQHSPCVTLERTAALLSIGWTDLQIRKFCRDLISYLMEKYDKILYEDDHWIRAKTQIQSDEIYHERFTGIRLHPQSRSGKREKLEMPDKKEIVSFMSTKIIRKTIRKPKARRAKVIVQTTQKTSSKRLKMRRQKPQRKRPRGRNNNARVAKYGLGETLGGDVVRNVQTIPKSEIYSFDERITSVNGSTNFAVLNTFALNPANGVTFPWLSNIAKLYERYQFESLQVCFQHDVSQFAAQGQVGLCYLSALYDASSAGPVNAVQISDSDPRVFAMPNQNLCLTLDAKQGMHPRGPLFCRPGALPGASDIKEYDAGNLFFSSEGTTNGTQVGFLQIKGRVRLFKRLLDGSNTLAPINNSVSWFQTTVAEVAVDNVEITLLMATASANGLSIVNTAGSFVPPAGNYLVDISVYAVDSVKSENFSTIVSLKKNTVAVLVTLPTESFALAAAGFNTEQANYLTSSSFVTANGTDAFILTAKTNTVTGIPSHSGTIRWTAM